MNSVQVVQKVESITISVGIRLSEIRWRKEVSDGLLGVRGFDGSRLMRRGQKPSPPVDDSARRQPARIRQNHERWQVGCFISQSISHPGSHAWKARQSNSSVNHEACGTV